VVFLERVRRDGARSGGVVNERDHLWVEWLLGVFGTTGLFVALALIGMAVQSTKMGWLSFVLGAFAFAVGPMLAVSSRGPRLTGGVVGLGMAIGAFAVILILASIYDIEIPPLFVLAGLLLGFMGGSLGEPWLGTTT
jgi:hypothetical protein